MSFRAKDGRFTQGVQFTLWDLRRNLLRLPGDHWIEPKASPRLCGGRSSPWRIPAARFPELVGIFNSSARPTVRVALWAAEHRRVPRGLNRVCQQPGCLNPLHHEETEMEQTDLYRLFFERAAEALDRGETFELAFDNPNVSTRYRHKLNAWRKKMLEQKLVPEEWQSIVLRHVLTSNGSIIRADSDIDDLAEAMQKALGCSADELEKQATSEPVSALDLLDKEDL